MNHGRRVIYLLVFLLFVYWRGICVCILKVWIKRLRFNSLHFSVIIVQLYQWTRLKRWVEPHISIKYNSGIYFISRTLNLFSASIRSIRLTLQCHLLYECSQYIIIYLSLNTLQRIQNKREFLCVCLLQRNCALVAVKTFFSATQHKVVLLISPQAEFVRGLLFLKNTSAQSKHVLF